MKEFGQTPEQLFFKPHPKKYSNKIVEIQIIQNDENQINEVAKNKIIKKENEEIIIENEIKEDKDLENNKQVNNENEEKIIIKKDIKEEKNVINNNLINNFSKLFKVKPDIDLKLIKQYKSVLNYDNVKIVTGTILPESNLIITGNIEGKLNIYYYYSGEISKQISLFHEIKNINPYF